MDYARSLLFAVVGVELFSLLLDKLNRFLVKHRLKQMLRGDIWFF